MAAKVGGKSARQQMRRRGCGWHYCMSEYLSGARGEDEAIYAIDQRSYRQIHKDFIHQIKIVIRASRKKFRFFLSSVVLFRYPKAT